MKFLSIEVPIKLSCWITSYSLLMYCIVKNLGVLHWVIVAWRIAHSLTCIYGISRVHAVNCHHTTGSWSKLACMLTTLWINCHKNQRNLMKLYIPIVKCFTIKCREIKRVFRILFLFDGLENYSNEWIELVNLISQILWSKIIMNIKVYSSGN